MKQYKKLKKFAYGGPGKPIGKYDFNTLSSDLLDDPLAPVTSATPPGVGQQITLAPNNTVAYTPVNEIMGTRTPTVNTKSATTPARQGVNWGQVGNIANSVAPFASNIINSFRRPLAPARSPLDSPPAFQRVNFQNDRNQVGRVFAASNAAADRGLESNAATAVRAYNQGQQLNELSKISAAENNTNIQIGNQQAMVNAQTVARNNDKLDDYNQSLVDRTIAQQREQSANISNAADKFVGIQNEKRKAKVDQLKTQTLMGMYDKSGVLQRQGKAWKKAGMEDPLGMNYTWVK